MQIRAWDLRAPRTSNTLATVFCRGLHKSYHQGRTVRTTMFNVEQLYLDPFFSIVDMDTHRLTRSGSGGVIP